MSKMHMQPNWLLTLDEQNAYATKLITHTRWAKCICNQADYSHYMSKMHMQPNWLLTLDEQNAYTTKLITHIRWAKCICNQTDYSH